MQPVKLLLTVILAAAAIGCSSLPRDALLEGDRSLTPTKVTDDIENYRETVVVWGGIITRLDNYAKSSEIQILAYPLLESGRPDVSKPPEGRFIAISSEYLESHDYRSGRELSLSGKIIGLRVGKIGEADYNFPALSIEKAVLWPGKGSSNKPDVRFNIGIGVGSGGRSSTGIGIGIGF